MVMTKTHTYKLTNYPREQALQDGTKVILKPMAWDDGDALLDFFHRIPAEDRYYLKEDVLDPAVIRRWTSELDYDRTLPILAWAPSTGSGQALNKIVADSTLHRTRAGARRHIGQIRLTVDPAYRMRGLGSLLLHKLAAIADDNGLERLLFEAVKEKEEEAIAAAEQVGFTRAGVLPGHAKDADGHPRDIILLEIPLGAWFEWWDF